VNHGENLQLPIKAAPINGKHAASKQVEVNEIKISCSLTTTDFDIYVNFFPIFLRKNADAIVSN